MLFSSPIPYQSDASIYYAAIRDLSWAAWLDSGGKGRFDILVAQPVKTVVTRDGRTEVSPGSDGHSTAPFEVLREQLGETIAPMPDIPFAGGLLGFWSYDLGQEFDSRADIASGGEPPEMAVGVYDWAIILDHQELSARLVSRQRHAKTAGTLLQVLERLHHAAKNPVEKGASAFRVLGEARSDASPEVYREAFDTVQKYLREGDCYQVNLARRYSAAATGDAFAAYLELRRLSPAPYSAFLDWPGVQVLCASPERFLQLRQGLVETSPIKGTRPRHPDGAEDARLAEELALHPKDRAENLMIVDLLRNDLGRNCIPGSVRAKRLFEVESFANVHHLVSTIQGCLSPGRDALDVLRDCFPGGSITGAPKLRAMEIIRELERGRRGVYCGAIGYVGYDGNMDTNIAIRTLVHTKNEISCWAGGGIVADSECEAEYQETLDKAAAMLELLRRFEAKPV